MINRTAKEKRKTHNKFLKRFGLVFVIAVIATFIDFITHSSSPAFYVPFEYYTNKIIFSVFWGMITLWVFKGVTNIYKKAFIFSATISIVLQVKYFLQGYALSFVFLFMFLHFLMFLVPSILIFKKYPDAFMD